MSASLRLLLSVAAFFGAWLLVFYVSLMLLPDALAWLQPLAALGFAIWMARRVWRQLEVITDASLPVFVGIGAAALGGLGFVGGFFGPMIFAPGANQGPPARYFHHRSRGCSAGRACRLAGLAETARL